MPIPGTKPNSPARPAPDRRGKTVEDAASGDAVKNLNRSGGGLLKYKRQAENFISREDVPESMKSGVKEYFRIIHNNN